ncbi:MAG: 4-alpha-glucanotransferase, partial [Deltaproteobacteria bacterium]|nr:4-alpha-glucanotransferase [Deltaproteobacteria bacterium]
GADVWAKRALFRVDGPEGEDLVAGCPPDAFNVEGQRWDNPVYDWEASAATGHRWWRERLGRALRCTDEIRMDHFRGFVEFYAFPSHLTPREGRWYPGPGAGVFEAFAEDLATASGRRIHTESLPVVLEDLGVIGPDVVALRERLGLPGTKVLQFGFDGQPDNPHHPDAIEGDRWCACTGTHDLPPAADWYERASREVRERFDAFARRAAGETPAGALVRVTLETPASLAVIPLQDLMGLGGRARINVPGTREGNWRWRAPRPDAATLAWCRGLNAATGRLLLAPRGANA